MTGERVCGCGCGESIADRRGRTLYFDERCRQRAYRQRVRDAAAAAGVSASVSLGALRTMPWTQLRNCDAPKPRKAAQRKPREGVSVYLRSLDAAEHLAGLLADRAEPWTAEVSAAVDAAIERRRRRSA